MASILAYIHEPDPEDTSIRTCHSIIAGRMILDRVLGAVADLEQPLDYWHDPSLEPNWINKHPADTDSDVPIEKLIEADQAARDLFEGCPKRSTPPAKTAPTSISARSTTLTASFTTRPTRTKTISS